MFATLKVESLLNWNLELSFDNQTPIISSFFGELQELNKTKLNSAKIEIRIILS